MRNQLQNLYEAPAYGMVEVAHYLRIPYQTLRYWLTGYNRRPPIIAMASADPPRLSFMNLLECHVLTGMREVYNLRIPNVRRSLANLSRLFPSPHPLVDEVFQTDRVDLFVEKFGSLINLSKNGQVAMKTILAIHLQRIERDPAGLFRFFPFVMERSEREPRYIEINPRVGFGKPVISGTGISTGIIAARFNARESVPDLAVEYGCSLQQIEEAVRWEQARPIAA